MNFQKCTEAIRGQMVDFLTCASKNINSKTQQKVAQNIEPSKIWSKLDSKASAFLGQVRKQELDKLFGDFEALCPKLDFENYGKPCFSGIDRYDDYVSINNKFFEYADYFVNKLKSDTPEAKEAIQILKQMNDRNGILFVGANSDMNKYYTEIFNSIIQSQ